MWFQEDEGKSRKKDSGALTVSKLVRRMKNVLEIEVGDVWVEGEVSNFRMQASGHAYFSLKDTKAQIACAMFGAKRREGWQALEDGAKVKVFGEVTLYEARGTAQLVVRKVEAAGQGDLQARFEALKKKLNEEGLFDEKLKKKLPAFPQRIGIVTSPTGAALQDMVNVLSRRAPWVTAYVYGVQVQGAGAERGIARAIRELSEPEKHGLPECDVLVVGRGGGSLEDLWNFNEEVVARAISECAIPVVSAVGHEIDFTIADFVADMRAPTPSAAAELVVPDASELGEKLGRLNEALKRPLDEAIRHAEAVLNFAQRGALSHQSERVLREPMMRMDEAGQRLSQSVERSYNEKALAVRECRTQWRSLHPSMIMERRRDRLDRLGEKLDQLVGHRLEKEEEHLKGLGDLVKALGPESAFERGFSITFGPDGKVVKSPEDVGKGDALETMTGGGVVTSKVE